MKSKSLKYLTHWKYEFVIFAVLKEVHIVLHARKSIIVQKIVKFIIGKTAINRRVNLVFRSKQTIILC